MKTLQRILDKLKTWFSGKAGLPRVLLLTLGALVVFAAAAPAHACGTFDIPCYIAAIFVKIFELLTALMGYILIMEVDALIRVAQYANFVSPGPTAVQIGWVVTRDLANMFFIVFLLIIAFSTIIGYEKYAYRNNLRRLLIMAVVINFSKTICGIFIDMSQVLMLTFVNGFKEAAAGNFLSAFQIQKLLDLAEGTNDPNFGLVLAMMLAFVLAAIAASVVMVMLVMMTFRIVMLWILIILSPIAFLTSSFPLGTNYYAQWWGELKKYLTSGPVIAFFLWLALASAQKSPDGLANESYQGGGGFAKQTAAATAEATASGNFQGYSIPSKAGRADTILSLVIVTCILFAGLKFASESGVAGSGLAKQIRSKAESYAKRAISAPIGAAGFAGGIARDQVGGAFRSVGGRAMNRVGTQLARVPIVGGLGRRLAASGEKLEEGRRVEIEKRSISSAKDLAKYSPGTFGSSLRVRGATDAQIKETAEAAIGNPKALAALQASGGADIVRDRLKKMGDKDPTQKGAYDNFMKANWKGSKDTKEQGDILKKFSGEDARKYMGAKDLNANTLGNLSKNGVSELLTNGKDDQKAAVMTTFDSMSGLGSLEALLKEKRMTYADIPAEAMSLAKDDTKGGLKARALAAAEKDSSMMKKFADDPKMREAMVPLARENFTNASTDIEKAQKLAVLSQFGAASSADFTPDVEVAMGQLSVKQLTDLERNTPTDSPNAQAGLERILTNAMKNGTSEMAQAILRSPTLSQRVPLTAARDAEKSTGSYTSSVNSGLSSKISDVERQRRTAVDKKDDLAAAAYVKQAEALRKLGEDIKTAARELGKVEERVVESRQKFGEAQKTGNAVDMSKFAAEIKTALKEVESKKAALAIANGEAKKNS